MNKKSDLVSNSLLAFSAIAFLLFYFILGFYNRPTNEDIVFISEIKDRNFFEFIKWMYQTWSGRWTSTCYFFLIISASPTFQGIHHFFFIYYCFTFFLLTYATSTIIQTALYKVFNVLIDKKLSLIYGILFIAGFYFSTIQNMEVWWWVCSSADTLQGIVFLLLGITFLLREKKNIFHYLLIALSFIYVGGCYEIYSLIIGILLLFSILYLLLKKPNGFASFKNNNFVKGIVIAFLSLVISAIISFTAPGNMKRRNLYDQNNTEAITSLALNTDFSISRKDFADKKYLAAISISALWLLLGMKIKNNANKIQNLKRIKKIVLLSSLPLLISIIVTCAFQIFVLRDYIIPQRGWTFSSFSLFSFSCFLFFAIGYFLDLPSIFHTIFKIIIPIFVFNILSSYLYRQYTYTSNYVKEYDKLITLLIETKKNKDIKVLYVDPLPNSGMLLPLEIGTEYINVPLKNILNLDYEIVLAQ